jgi:glycosyltransferase involved in cell wall biosynthesis
VVGVADPAYGDELQHLADELAVAGRVRMRALPRSSLREVYADADAFVFPSRWDEPFGLVPIEAMTQRTPVVATRRGGSAEFLVDGANCLEFDADDDEQLARAVRRVADDPALRRRLVDGGVATARRFTVDALADTLETVHRQAAGA